MKPVHDTLEMVGIEERMGAVVPAGRSAASRGITPRAVRSCTRGSPTPSSPITATRAAGAALRPPRRSRSRRLIDRPETLSRVGTGSERVPFVDRANAVPRPAKPARQTSRPLGRQLAPRTCRLRPRACAPLKYAAPAAPAAARRRPCPPGDTLAVRPRPETKSRVGALDLLLRDAHHLRHRGDAGTDLVPAVFSEGPHPLLHGRVLDHVG